MDREQLLEKLRLTCGDLIRFGDHYDVQIPSGISKEYEAIRSLVNAIKTIEKQELTTAEVLVDRGDLN